MPVSYSGTAITWPDSSTTTSGWTGFKNRIINGAMMIDQRNAGASTTPTSSAYTLDRWQANIDVASKLSFQQSTTVPAGFKNSLLVTSLSAYSISSSDQFNIQQRIEGYNVADLGYGAAGAATITISFWARSSLTGTFGGGLRNSAQDRSYPFSYTISAANTWEQKTITVTGDTTGTWLTDNGTGLIVTFSMGAGSTRISTAGSWQAGDYRGATGQTNLVATNGATFYITGVQLERGSTASSFEYRDYGRELFLCQRYFFGFGNLGVSKGYIFPQPGNQPSGAGGMPIVFTPPATMRTSPDVAYNISSGNYTTGTVSGTQWRLVAPAIDSCTLSGTTVGIVGLSAPNAVGISLLYATISRQPSIIEFGSTAYLTFSAEL